MLVREPISTHPVTVRAATSVRAALRLLADHDITSMPVVSDRGLLIGVVSEADPIRDLVDEDRRVHLLAHESDRTAAGCVADVMTPHAITVTTDTDLGVAVELMMSTSVASLPVVDRLGAVVGMLSRRDVVHVFARADELLERDVDVLLTSSGLKDRVVEVHDGVTELSGRADDREADLARALAAAVPGVASVRLDSPPARGGRP